MLVTLNPRRFQFVGCLLKGIASNESTPLQRHLLTRAGLYHEASQAPSKNEFTNQLMMVECFIQCRILHPPFACHLMAFINQ